MSEKPEGPTNSSDDSPSTGKDNVAQGSSACNSGDGKKKPYSKPILRKCFQIDQVSAYGV